MEDDGESGGPRLSKRFAGGKLGGGEVDYKSKAGTAWSHSYLNQKPWHPLSYPNQRRKWIAEQTHAQRENRASEVAREFAQEQEFFRQTSLLNDKEKEKMEMMKAVSFMYLRPPGYNAESAKAAEIADEQKKVDVNNAAGESSNPPATVIESKISSDADKKKKRVKDVFGRALPTEEEFEVLKNAPRLETGAPARVKPFAVEIRNVRCVRCGKFGHQSGDRECPLKDAIMPNEESRLKRDDPLVAINAQIGCSEPLKWELKQRPGMSPPRGGFDPDDPNQQIVAADDIFDEYGGFLSGGGVPPLLSDFHSSKAKKHSKSKRKHRHKHRSLHASGDREAHGNRSPSSSEFNSDKERRRSKMKREKRRRKYSDSSESEGSDAGRRRRRKDATSSDSGNEAGRRKAKSRRKKRHRSASVDSSGSERRHRRRKHRHRRSGSASESD